MFTFRFWVFYFSHLSPFCTGFWFFCFHFSMYSIQFHMYYLVTFKGFLESFPLQSVSPMRFNSGCHFNSLHFLSVTLLSLFTQSRAGAEIRAIMHVISDFVFACLNLIKHLRTLFLFLILNFMQFYLNSHWFERHIVNSAPSMRL